MAGVLSSAAFRTLQALKRRTMRHTATVEKSTRVEGPGGTDTTAWVPVAGLVDLPCGFVFDAPVEAIAADAVKAVAKCKVELIPADLDAAITSAHRIAITHDVEGLPSPLTVAVIGPQPRGADEVTRVVRCERVGG